MPHVEARRAVPGSARPDTLTAPFDVVSMLDMVALTIVQALGFGVAVVNIARPDGSSEVVSVAGDDGARESLLGAVRGAEVWDKLFAVSEPWGRLRFADHRHEAADVGMLDWVADLEPIDVEDAWHPADALFAPLTAADGSRLGTLSVYLPRDGRRPGTLTCKALEAFAVSAALAIEHAALRARAEASERRYKYLASHDPLTGVGSRSILLERLERATSLGADQRALMAVVFVDLDGFKAINDRHSHQAGDFVLKSVAHRIQALVRPHDTVVRWGGDEFLILLEHLPDESVALAVAQRITAAVARPLRRFGHDLSVSASVGVAFEHAADEINIDDLIKYADTAMYEVKRTGGNGCAAFQPVEGPPRLDLAATAGRPRGLPSRQSWLQP